MHASPPSPASCWWCPTAHDGALLLALALACTLLPFALSLVALRHMSAFAQQLAVNLEPVYAIVLAALLLGEQRELTPLFYVGVVVILAAVFIHPLLGRPRPLQHRKCWARRRRKARRNSSHGPIRAASDSWQARRLTPTGQRMYLEHYGLSEPPFSITPDPRFVFLSERHRDALAHLLFGISQGGGGGFVQLTGEVGTGKTTLCRLLLEQVPETRARRAGAQSATDAGRTAGDHLRGTAHRPRMRRNGRRGSLKALVDALNAYLLDAYAQGLRVVLIIDEAQNLSVDALEQVRLLTNLETPTQKLLQIVLLASPNCARCWRAKTCASSRSASPRAST